MSAGMGEIPDWVGDTPDPDELVRWAERYGHPEGWVQKAQQLHGENERLRAEVRKRRIDPDALLRDDVVEAARRGHDAAWGNDVFETDTSTEKLVRAALAAAVKHLTGDGER
jgi:hypothetical protein